MSRLKKIKVKNQTKVITTEGSIYDILPSKNKEIYVNENQISIIIVNKK